MIPTTLVRFELVLRVLGGEEGYAIGGSAREAFEATPTSLARLGPASTDQGARGMDQWAMDGGSVYQKRDASAKRMDLRLGFAPCVNGTGTVWGSTSLRCALPMDRSRGKRESQS